ncbi:MAG TPA: 5'-3' exonuclease [Candidatus Nitrosotalea sp.]|nr:5'-3' exonuclease [Candidatus Nitrosotalea sp.]
MTDWLFIDGSSLIFRAFHALPRSIRAPDGTPVNATRGFLDNLSRLLRERGPRGLGVASDSDWRPAWRVALIPSYKAHRVQEPVPSELEPQFPQIHAILAAAGVPFVGAAGFEAEDVIATWTDRAGEEAKIEIGSGDRDLFTLIRGERVRVLYPERGGLAVVDDGEVERRYGVPAHLYGDFAILRGDPSDGLPGLPGVGAKRAAELVIRHQGLEGLLGSGVLRPEACDYLRRAEQVVRPRSDLDLELPPLIAQATTDADGALELGRRWGAEGPVTRLLEILTRIRS